MTSLPFPKSILNNFVAELSEGAVSDDLFSVEDGSSFNLRLIGEGRRRRQRTYCRREKKNDCRSMISGFQRQVVPFR